jgi:dCMP deaminase
MFLLEAVLWSRKSHDEQTQCGCVIVNNKTCLSTGYNGFIRDIDDTLLPRTRPEKYPYMIHAEANAIYNCTRNGKPVTGSTVYVTAIPCGDCFQMLYQCGVSRVVFSDFSIPKCVVKDSSYSRIVELVSSKIDINYIPAQSIDVSFFQECLSLIKNQKHQD